MNVRTQIMGFDLSQLKQAEKMISLRFGKNTLQLELRATYQFGSFSTSH